MKFELGDAVRVYNYTDPFPKLKGSVIEIKDEPGFYTVGCPLPKDGIAVCKDTEMVKDLAYLSPTSLALFEKDRDEFYMKYLARTKPPAFLQTQPMSIGSAFDAYVKSYIIKTLSEAKGFTYSKEYDNVYEFENLFNKQVEEHNRVWARPHGAIAFDRYKASGALAALMLEICSADKAPRFEFRMEGKVKGPEGATVPIVGVPDLYFQNPMDAHVIIDWKVNGYCSNYPQSPKPFYTVCRDSWLGNNSRNNNQCHKDTMPALSKGILVDVAHYMETVNIEWAAQLATYAWLMGEPVGGDFIVGVEQLSCSPGTKIRVASYRNRVSGKYQAELFARYKKAWDCVSASPDGFFPEVTVGESRARCELLEKQAVTLHPTGDAKEDWFSENTRRR